MSETATENAPLTVVLVHGACADASSWNGVIERLQAAGIQVTAPAIPLRGIAYDSAYLASFLKQIPGRVLAVFGLPRANEDDSLRALRSAVELRAELEASDDVAVGIGVDTGSVLARPSAPNRPAVVGDLLGDVAGAAYAAGPGEILVGETTRLLGGRALRLGPARRLRGRKRFWKLLELRRVCEKSPG